MFKHIWAVEKKKKKYNLWVKWVHHTYIKEADVGQYKPHWDSSWYWKKLIEIKEECSGKEMHRTEEYRISEGYRTLMEKHDKERWSSSVWNKMNVPKHSFIFWLVMRH